MSLEQTRRLIFASVTPFAQFYILYGITLGVNRLKSQFIGIMCSVCEFPFITARIADPVWNRCGITGKGLRFQYLEAFMYKRI